MSAEYNPKSNVTFGSVNLSTYNAFAIYCNIFDRPERDVDVVSVPGRNGDLIFDNGRYKNLDRVYTIQVTGVTNAQNLINALTATIGYQELEDDYDTTVYYIARLKNRPRVTQFVGNAVLLTVTFDRKPQRFLKSGRDTAITGTYIGNTPNIKSGSGYSGVIKITINNTMGETFLPRIYFPGDQVRAAYFLYGFQLDVDLSTPNERYFIEENQLFYIQYPMYYSGNRGAIEIDSEKRAFIRYDGGGSSSTVNKYYKFLALSPGMTYVYFVFEDVGHETKDWAQLKSPQVYPRWWTI